MARGAVISFLLITAVAFPARAGTGTPRDKSHGDPHASRGLPTDVWNGLLAKFVRQAGSVDYQGLAKEQDALERFIKAHADLDVRGADDAARKAIYINLYNATMMLNLLKHASAEKIDVAGPKFLELRVNKIAVPGGNIWDGDYKVTLAGQPVSLDDIEHGLLRGGAKGALAELKVKTLDPRIHAAVNCAALSCPRVREVAYSPDNVDAMLDENMREYVSSEAQFRKVDDDTLRANQIVFWYYDDFEDYGKTHGQGGAGGYLAGFLTPAAKDRDWKAKHLASTFNDRGKLSLKLSSAYEFHYDWRVNDVRNQP